MRVLGISSGFHTASAALVVDGVIAGAAAEERFTRVKHDPGFPERAVAALLQRAEIGHAAELDEIVYYEEPHVKFTRVLTSTLGGFPGSRRAFVGAMKQWLGSRLWQRDHISRVLDVHPRRVTFVPHHLSHAAQAFVGSGMDEAAVLTLDAVGEWDTVGIAHASLREGSLSIDVKETLTYPNSLGLFYAAFTAFLGFRPNADECSTMALAAFGTPRFEKEVRQVLQLERDGTFVLIPGWLDLLSTDQPFTQRFIDVFGQPRSRRAPLSFASFGKGNEVPPDQQRWADIAASVQRVLEEAVLGLVRRAHRLTGARNLCLAGGVALNCVANRRVEAEGPFERLFIPPDPGDGGAALGAAHFAAAEAGDLVGGAALQPYLGLSYPSEDCVELLEHMDPAHWDEYRLPDLSPVHGLRVEVEKPGTDDSLLDRIVDDLLAGRVVGWVDGRFEMGPRALGHRSLLAAPDRVDAAEKLSTRIKRRAPFRPYAFSVCEADAERTLGWDDVPATGRWMQTVATVAEDLRPKVAAAIHSDGTTRPQVVGREDAPRYHALLERYGQASGLGALLNTSFNPRGSPIVATPTEALMVFARTDLDTLVLGDTIVRKEAE